MKKWIGHDTRFLNAYYDTCFLSCLVGGGRLTSALPGEGGWLCVGLDE